MHGLLVDPQDPEVFAAAVTELLRDPRQAAEIAQRGQERQRDEFDIEVAARRLEQLYEELYAASPRANPARVAARRPTGS